MNRCVAIALFLVLLINKDISADELPSIPGLVNALRSDSVRGNALNACAWIMPYGMISHRPTVEKSEELRFALEKALSDEDYQLRQFAVFLLTERVYPAQSVKESDWPDAVFTNLIAGLHGDCISLAGRTFSNAMYFISVLYRLNDRRPERELLQALGSEDSQARFCAAAILSKYLQNSVQPKISAELVRNMKDDEHHRFINEIAAYRALILLGRENLVDLLKSIQVEDWQQAALLQCAACHFGVDWTAPETFMDRWTDGAMGYRPSRICTAALFLHPETRSYLENKQTPELLERMWRLSVSLRDPQKKERWASTWIWFLQTDEKIDVYHRDPWFAPWVFEAGH
ncbi:MAG TPA: hypothetical protein PLZ55_14480 [bacterium]|nr:hypothetical protein [bacterium]